VTGFVTDGLGLVLDIVAWAWVAIELRVALLGIVVVCGSIVLRRASASARHLLWRGFLVGSLVVPVVLLGLTRRFEVRLAVPPVKDWSLLGAARMSDGGDRAASELASRIAGTLVVLWIGGGLFLLGAQLRSSAAVRRIRRRARPVNLSWQPAIEAGRAAFGLTRAVPVLRSTDVDVPVVCGSVRPAVILPAASDDWPPELRDAVLRHELAHVARGDVAFAAFARFTCALHWANPLVWLAAGRAMLEAERAADDAVLVSGIRASSYSALLLDFAIDLRPARADTLAFARVSSLAERVRAILDPAQSRKRVGRRAAAAVVALLMVASGLVGATRLSATALAGRATPPVARPAAGVFDTTDAVGALIATMRDESPHVRAATAASLGAFGDSRARASLTRALADSSASVRFYAERALRALRSAR